MRIALVQSEAASDRNALSVACWLQELGHIVTLVVPRTELGSSTPAFVLHWRARGFLWIPVAAARLLPAQEHFPRDPTLATARSLAGVLLTFDCAWFFETHWAMPLLRERRFREGPRPVVVLSPLSEEDPVPSSLEEINRSFSRQYSRKWADMICACLAKTEVESALAQAATRRKDRKSPVPAQEKFDREIPAVTVCIPYFEAFETLPLTLQSLERQTCNQFTVIVIDDGSFSEAASAAFDSYAEVYAERGWKFIRQTNGSAGAARNRAASEASTEFLLFLDSDDIAMPSMIDRFLRGVRLTGDDCLVAPNYGFKDDPEGPCSVLYDPPGNSLIASMCDDMHGGSCIFIRRTAFWAIGGFTEQRGLGFEDYELHVRCNLAGLPWDVLPEFVYRYRMPGKQNVSRATPAYPNHLRVLRWYEQRMRAPNGGSSCLGSLPLALASAYRRHDEISEKVKRLETNVRLGLPKKSSAGRELKLLLVTCNFPFGVVSGWHTRVQQMIRYFGSRYELTLMTVMPREDLAPVRKQAFKYLHSLIGVEGSNTPAIAGEELPHRVQQHYTDTLQAALRSLSTDHYHLAFMDQIFMAECRHEIDTIKVLTEHNIESRLLQQAAARSWSHTLSDAYQNSLSESERLSRYEDRVWPEFALRAVVSETDRTHMQQRLGEKSKQGKTVIAANGADPKSWLSNIKFDSQTVFFPGHLAYLPNVDAVEFLLSEIWPKVKRQQPNVRLMIAGRDPSPVVRAAIARAAKHTGAGIDLYAGPKSMDVLARRASVSIAPLRLGSGTRCKILESMAWGIPVVSTTLGAEGIEATEGEHLLIRDDADQFAEAILQLLRSRELWLKLRNNGRELVRERYSWDRVFEPLEDGLIELVS